MLDKVVQKENSKHKEYNLEKHEIIEKLQRKHQTSLAKTLCWEKKFRFQRAKVTVLKKKIKDLREQASPSGMKLNILDNAITLC